MANTRAGNVIKVDTSGAIAGPVFIQSLKYIGNTSGTASIKEESSSGNDLWEEEGDANIHDEVCISAGKGVYVTVANGAVVYLYLK